jgi:hypothetical protein
MSISSQDIDNLLSAQKQAMQTRDRLNCAIHDNILAHVHLNVMLSSPEKYKAFLAWADEHIVTNSGRDKARAQAVRNLLINAL